MWLLIIATLSLIVFSALRIESKITTLSSPNLPESQILALYDFYNSTHGENWSWKDTATYGAHWHFNATANPCAPVWQGITCLLLAPGTSYTLWQLNLRGYNLRGRISNSIGDFPNLAFLSLGGNYLTGSLPDSICALSQLGTLELSNNYVNGTLPFNVGDMAMLENLVLTNNKLTGVLPSSMQRLTRLSDLGLASNHFNGTIPDFVGSFSELVYCELNYNYFVGSIPTSFSNLHKLNNLDLYNNELTGPLPALDALTALQYLQVEYNNLHGTLPDSIGRLIHLRELSMQFNNFSGSIPASIGYLTKLERISLQNNNLNGSIPSAIGNLTLVTSLQLAYNALTGSIPCSMGLLTQLTSLDLRKNLLDGPLPASLGNWTMLTELYLSFNGITGPLPDTIGNLTSLSTLQITYTLVSGQIPESIGFLTNLYQVELYTNRFSGTLPSSLGNMLALSEFLISENRIHGPIPASLGQLPGLRTLNLHSNQLNGTLPAELGNIATLTELELADNHFTGPVPESLANLHGLIVLSLSSNRFNGPLPAFLSSLPGLLVMLLYENRFTGTIPEEFGSMVSLEALVLGGNPLHGTIPAALGNLVALKDLSLAVNFLTGTIPPELGQLAALSSLDLSHNYIESTIPASLGNFPVMTFLGISYNLLTGTLPKELGKLAKLSYVSLFNNYLTGSIPTSFRNLSELASLQLQNNALSGTLDDVFDPATQYLLQTIQLSSNELTGAIPAAAFQLPILQSFVTINNCFDGTLPDTMCSAVYLNTLDLDALHSASACRTKLFDTSVSAYIMQDAVHGSIPACVFQLPFLQTLHISSNALTGSLPGDLVVSPALLDLSLSYNKLTGSIPHGIQERPWYNLDLSYNRFSGTLSPKFAHQVEGSLAVYLQYNKLSGVLPAAVIQAENVSVLQSSIFSCDPEHSDLPANDPYSDIYQCGSDTTNTPYYAWLVCFVVAAVTAVLVVLWRARLDQRLGITAKLEVVKKWLAFSDCTANASSPIDDEAAAVETANLKHVFLVCRSLCQVGLWCVLYAVLVLAPVYIILTRFCGTHTYEYIWSVSIILLQGDTALAVEFVLLFVIAVLFLYLCVVYLRPTAQAALEIERRSTIIRLSNMSSSAHSVAAAATAVAKPSVEEPSSHDVQEIPVDPADHQTQTSYHTWSMCALYVLINFTVVGLVNIYYVFLKLNATPSFQLTISGFKVVWNGLVSPMLSRYFLRPRAEHTTLELFVALANTIAIPILAVVFVSPDCFYHAFERESDITVAYTAYVCSLSLVPGECIVDDGIYEVVKFPPPYLYNYQCSYVFAEFYVPAFIYVCLFATFGVPLVEVMMAYLHATAVRGTRWFAFIDRVAPRILKTVVDNATFPRNVIRPYFDATQFVITQLTYLALLMTFGVVFPPLAFALGVTMVGTIVLTRAKVGRFLHNAVAAQLSGYDRVIAAECANIGGVAMLRRSVWIILNLSTIFYGLFMFDTIGSTTGFKGSFWVLIVVPLFPTFFYGAYRLYLRYAPEQIVSMLRLPTFGSTLSTTNTTERASDSKALAEGVNVRTISALHIAPASTSKDAPAEEYSAGTEL